MFPKRLAMGYRAFLQARFTSERYEMLAESGQRPQIMQIGYVDSRVSPEVIFDAARRALGVAQRRLGAPGAGSRPPCVGQRHQHAQLVQGQPAEHGSSPTPMDIITILPMVEMDARGHVSRAGAAGRPFLS
jgi:hypothetical protein